MKKILLIIITLSVSISNLFSQCPKAEVYLQKIKDADNMTPTERAKSGDKIQGWTQFATWETYKCECEAGNLSPTDAERLKNHLNAIRGTIQSRYAKYGSVPKVIKKCKSSNEKTGNTSQEENDKFSFVNDDLINAEAQSLISDLATNSNNPELIEFSTKLDGISGVQNDVNSYRNFFNITPSQKDVEFDKAMTNIAQGVAVIQLFSKLLKNSNNTPRELTANEKLGIEFMWGMRNKIKIIHSETQIVSNFDASQPNALNNISKHERKFKAYDIATSAERCAIIKYFWSNRLYDYDYMISFYNSVQEWDVKKRLKYIEEWENKYNVKDALYCANSDLSFETSYKLLQGKEAQYYQAIGDDVKADLLFSNLYSKTSFEEALNLIQQAYINEDYKTIDVYYNIIKLTFDNEKKFRPYYTINKRYNSRNKEELTIGAQYQSTLQKDGIEQIHLERNEVYAILTIGCLSAIRTNNQSQAVLELAFLKNQLDKLNTELQSQVGHEQEQTEEQLAISKTIYNSIYSYYLLHFGDKSEALAKIESVIKNKYHSSSYSQTVTKWIVQVYYEVLYVNGFHSKAEIIYEDLNAPLSYHSPSPILYDPQELTFTKCRLLYLNEEYNRALRGLSMLELHEQKNKYTLLKAQIYQKQKNSVMLNQSLNQVK